MTSSAQLPSTKARELDPVLAVIPFLEVDLSGELLVRVVLEAALEGDLGARTSTSRIFLEGSRAVGGEVAPLGGVEILSNRKLRF